MTGSTHRESPERNSRRWPRRIRKRVIFAGLLLATAAFGLRVDGIMRRLAPHMLLPTPRLLVTEVTHAFERAVPSSWTPVVPHSPRVIAKAAARERERERVILATVSTYQAVAEQCGEDPEITASGVHILPNVPYPIVANNALPFGTKVRIRDRVYTVADRMHPRYGAAHFDILTRGKNYKLMNEPVVVLGDARRAAGN